MNNKEAIELIKVAQAEVEWSCPMDYAAAFDLAIKALEQKPCEDAISRRDALDALHMCLATNSYNEDVTGDSYICYEEAEYEIENLQSVQPKPKIGWWIEQIDQEENCRTLICSNCDRPALHDGDSIWKHKFCPNCGAKMVELQESEVIKNADGNN